MVRVEVFSPYVEATAFINANSSLERSIVVIYQTEALCNVSSRPHVLKSI